MNLTFTQEDGLLPVSNQLTSLLTLKLVQKKINPEQYNSITFNFHDPTYSVERGGFHPVEIRLYKQDGKWHFDYITDFCFVGVSYPELVKEIDWLVQSDQCFHLYMGEIPPVQSHDLFLLWERNFISYVKMSVFELSVQAD